MMHDPLAMALSNIKTAERTGKPQCLITPISTVLLKVLDLMKTHGYVGSYDILEDGRGKLLRLHLLGAINDVGAVKPRFSVSFRAFEKFEKRYLPAKDFGLLLVSTSQGIMTHQEAKQKSLGGVLLSFIY